MLHVATEGSGPPLVLVHGWGMHSDVWLPVLPALAARHTVTRIDLPGHGRSAGRLGTLEAAADAVLAAAPAQAVWLGWSLGGMVATEVAHRAPERVKRLVLVASNPRFVAGADWTHAMAPDVLAAFADGLAANYQATLTRFLSLQFRGVAGAPAILRELRAMLAGYPPQGESLRDGLDILAGADLRPRLAALPVPASAVLGELDTLVPAAVREDLVGLHPPMDVAVISGAGHAPFLSHSEAFLAALAAQLA